MPNERHLAILRQGAEAWNSWREDHPDVVPDLSKCDLSGQDLAGFDLSQTDLSRADLTRTNLSKAVLVKAKLFGSTLAEADLSRAELTGAGLTEANLRHADLSKARLRRAELTEANLTKADLSWANLAGADLTEANLSGARLHGANLSGARLTAARIRRTDLTSADLSNTDVTGIRFDRHSRFLGIRIDSCYGSQIFKRHAQDQDYIEEFRSKSALNKVIYLVWLVLADCGRSISLWSMWAFFALYMFAMKFNALGRQAFHLGDGLEWSFDTTLYYSVITFSTLGFGDVSPITNEAKHWVVFEVVSGYIMLGGLISIFANKLARRS